MKAVLQCCGVSSLSTEGGLGWRGSGGGGVRGRVNSVYKQHAYMYACMVFSCEEEEIPLYIITPRASILTE